MHPSAASPGRRLAGPVGLAAVAVVTIGILSTRGLAEGTAPAAGLISAVFATLSAGPIALAYLLGAMGLGRLAVHGSMRTSAHRHGLQLGVGLALMLWLSHAIGALGLLSGEGVGPRIIGWGSVGIGLALLAHQLALGSLRPERWPVWSRTAPLWGLPIGLIAVAAASPPGALWASEFGAYDALSYHLQLPKEWAAPGAALASVEHNVYSYLPSYVEAAYLHLSAMTPGADVVSRTVGGEGAWILSCHMLHAGIAVIAGVLTARASIAVVRRAAPDVPESVAGAIGSLAGLMVLGTPWTIVTGSLAYNEAAVLALGAAGALAASDRTLRPLAAGAISGLCVGVAASAKPTAALFVGPVVGVLLLAHVGRGGAVRAVVAGTVLGVVAIAPWLVRNALAGGNPVFPFAAGLLGAAHWSPEQIERYAASHMVSLSPVQRVLRLVSTEFGWAHPQFGAAGLALVLGAAMAIVSRATRRAGVAVLIGVVLALIAWMTMTHLQSRFLMPLLVPAALVMALGAAGAWTMLQAAGRQAARDAAPIAGAALLALACVGASVLIFLRDGGGVPNRLLVAGPGALSGLAFAESFDRAPAEERERALDSPGAGPAWFVNLSLKPHETGGGDVYLLGDAAALYFAGAMGDRPAKAGASRVRYHTTWDRSPLGDAIAASPDDPRAWTRALAGAGVRHVLVNFDELGRLIERDRYFDPRVRTADIARWLGFGGADGPTGVTLVRRWPRVGAPPGVPSGHALYRLDAPGEGSGGTR